MTHKTFIPALRRISVLALAALAIMALMACPGKHKNYDDDDEEDETEVTGALQIDDEFLNSFDPNVPFEQTGHSRPFRIHPREDMTISAEAGAFERDVNIRVTDLSTEKMIELDKMFEGTTTTMLFAYDLDAGLPTDSVIPGKYTVSIDLEKHGIPEELYPYFVMYRVAGDGSLQPLNVKIKGHTATYQASQNSITLGAICIYTLAAVAIAVPANYIISRYPAITQTVRRALDLGFWKEWNDAVYRRVPDDFGNFYIAYRFSMTEKADQTSEYVKKMKELTLRETQLYGEALLDNPPSLNIWDDNEKIRIEREKKHLDLLINDQRLRELSQDPIFDTPQSVNDIITATKLSNRFCRSEQHMKPLSYEYVTFLTPDAEALGEEAFCYKTGIIDPCIIVNYEMIVDYANHLYNKDEFWTTLTKLAHEIMHLYQYEYLVTTAFKDNCYLEATGALVEPHFIDWLIKTGKVSGIPVTNAFSPEAERKMGYSSRASKELLSSPLGKECPSYKDVKRVQHERGYMLADMLQYLWDHQPNPSDTIDFDKMTNRYAYHKGILKTMQDIFGIEGDAAFAKYYEGFCQKFISEIEQRQERYRKKAAGDHLVLPNVQHDPSHCVMRVKDLGEKGSATGNPFMVNTFRIEAKPADGRYGPANRDNYNLFAVASEKIQPREIKFTFVKAGDFTDIPTYCAADSAGSSPRYCYAAVMTRPGSKDLTMGDDYYYDIVALYEPTATPEVKGPSLDKKGLLVKPKCTPPAELKEKEYVTGLQIVMENKKTGNLVSYVDRIKEWKDQFVATYNSLGISDTTDIDVSLRSRWYYDTPQGQRYYSPATDIVNYKRQNTRVQQEVVEDTTVVEDEPGIVGDYDHGLAGLVVDETFPLKIWGYEELYEYIMPGENEATHSGAREAVVRVKIYADGSFVIDAPAINFTKNETNGSGVLHYTFSDIHIEGKGDFNGTDESQYYEITNIKIPMQTFHLNMNGSRQNEHEGGGTIHMNSDFYFDVKSSNGARVTVGKTQRNGKIDVFGIEIPDVIMKVSGSSGDESANGERQQSFMLIGQISQP